MWGCDNTLGFLLLIAHEFQTDSTNY